MFQNCVFEEWVVCCDFVVLYCLLVLYGWDDLIFIYIFVCVFGFEYYFLINFYGMMFEEIMVSSFVKVDWVGEKVVFSDYDVNLVGFIIYSVVYEVCEDVYFVMYLYMVVGIVVSVQCEGLLLLLQYSFFLLVSLSYYDYEGVVLNFDEKVCLVCDLGYILLMILCNYGLLMLGYSVVDIFLKMFMLQCVCEIQIVVQVGGGELVCILVFILVGICVQSEKVMCGLGVVLIWLGLLWCFVCQNLGYDV